MHVDVTFCRLRIMLPFFKFLFFFIAVCCASVRANYITVSSMFRDEALYLEEWIEYHKAIGVDHFRLYNNGSRDNFMTVLSPYIESGLVQVVPWQNEIIKDKSSLYCYKFIDHQVEALKDAITKIEGRAEWLAFIDIDEFIVPMKQLSLKRCLKRYFSQADAVYLNWRNFGTSGQYLNNGKKLLKSLISCSSKNHARNRIGKTIFRVKKIKPQQIINTSFVHVSKRNQYYNGSAQILNMYNSHAPEVEDEFLRINHYPLRDEIFFSRFRKKRANFGYGGNELLMKHHNQFSQTSDKRVVKILSKLNLNMLL